MTGGKRQSGREQKVKWQVGEGNSEMQLNFCAFMRHKLGLMQQRDKNVNYDHITAM